MDRIKIVNTLYKHEKNCWTVELLSDGTIVATSNYERQVNIQHHIAPGAPIADSLGLIPYYVFEMLVGARYEWTITYLRGLKVAE
jgi:hypothetical protein